MREINELGIVTAVGIDKANSPNKYSLTVQIANPSTENSGDNKNKTKNTVWLGTQEGESIFEAARELLETSSRRAMWAHNSVVIIGEALAREGITPVVDYFTHNPELRMKTIVVVSKGSAKDFFTAPAGMETPSGVSFFFMENYRRIPAESVNSHMLQVSSELRNKYTNPLISEVSLEKTMIKPEDTGVGGDYTDTVNLSGAAVFKKDKMIGWLSPQETRGISWILNETSDTLMTVVDSQHEGKSVSIETKDVKAKIKSVVIGGKPNISIKITGFGDIVEEDGLTSKSIDEVKDHIASLLDKNIEEEVIRSMETIQKVYKVDVIDLASIVHTQNDRAWETELKYKWEKIFPQIPVSVSVDIDILSSTLNQEPMKIY